MAYKSLGLDNMAATFPGAGRWRANFFAFLLLAVWLYSFFEPLGKIAITYLQSSSERHSFFIIPISLGILLHRLLSNHRITPHSSWFGVMLFLCINASYVYVSLSGQEILQYLLIILMVPGIFLITHGSKFVNHLKFPLLFLLLAVPAGSMFAPLVQRLFLEKLVKLAEIFGTVVYWDNGVISSSIGKITLLQSAPIANNIFLLLAIGIFYLYWIKAQGLLRNIMLLALFVVLPFIFNLAGIFSLLNSHFLSNQFNTNESIIFFGNMLLILGVALCLPLVTKLKKSKRVRDENNHFSWQDFTAHQSTSFIFQSSITVFILLVTPWIKSNLLNNPWNLHVKVDLHAPIVANWRGPEPLQIRDWQPMFHDADATMLQEYYKNDTAVGLFSAYYYSPKQLSSLIGTENQLYDKSRWMKIMTKAQQVNLQGVRELELTETIVKNGPYHKVIWHWFFIGTKNSANADLVQLLDNLRVVTNFSSDVGVIAVSTDIVTDDVEAARKTLRDFLNALNPELDKLMHPTKFE